MYRFPRTAAFTLIEVLVASFISMVALAMLMSSFLHLARASALTATYAKLHADVRHAADIVTRDILVSSAVLAFPQTNDITLLLQTSTGTNSVRYHTLNGTLLRTPAGGNESVLAERVSAARFAFYTRDGTNTANISNAFLVELSIAVTNSVRDVICRDQLLTRTLMRNKEN